MNLLLFQFRQPIKRGISRTPCCRHRAKTRQRDDIVDKTHHQMYASTASMTQNNGIHVTLEQTLAPSGSTSGSTSSTGTASSNGDNQKVNTISQNVFLNNMRNTGGPVSLPGSVRATPTLELYPRHLRTHSYTQAIPNTRNTNTNFVYNPVTAPVHRRYHNQDFALRNLRSDSQEFALRNMRSDSVNSILQDKIHGRQSSSSAGYYLGYMVKGIWGIRCRVYFW